MNTNFNSFVLRPSEAVFFEETNTFFTQDPYVVITIGDQKFKTTVDKKGGLNPHWSNHFDIEGLANQVATVQVYDRDLLIPDYLLGEAIFSLSERQFGKLEGPQKVDLYKNDKRVGEITIEFSSHGSHNELVGGLTGTREEEYPITQGDINGSKPFTRMAQEMKNDINSLGNKFGNLGKKIGDKLGVTNPHEVELPVEPVSKDFAPTTLHTSEPIQPLRGDRLVASDYSNLDSTKDSNRLLDDTNTGLSAADEQVINVQGQEIHKASPTLEKHDIGEDKLGPSLGLDEEIKKTGLGEAVRDFDINKELKSKNLVDDSDKWSTVSNQGSTVDKSDLLERQERRGPMTQGKDLVDKGKEKLAEWEQKGKEKMNELGTKMNEVFTDKPNMRPVHEPRAKEDFNKSPSIFEKGMDKIDDMALKAMNKLETPFRRSNEKLDDASTLEPPKENVFDKGFDNTGFTQKPQDFKDENLVDKTDKLKLDDSVNFSKPTFSFDNQDTKTQFLSNTAGLDSERPLQKTFEAERGTR